LQLLADRLPAQTSINWTERKREARKAKDSSTGVTFPNEELEKIKNASPRMTNLGPGISSLGAETYKLLRLNSLNHYAIK